MDPELVNRRSWGGPEKRGGGVKLAQNLPERDKNPKMGHGCLTKAWRQKSDKQQGDRPCKLFTKKKKSPKAD